MERADLEALETFATNIAEAGNPKRAEQVRAAISELSRLRAREAVYAEEIEAARDWHKARAFSPKRLEAAGRRMELARHATDEARKSDE